MVALNAGAAIYVSGRAESLEAGIQQAQDILATGVGLERLEQYANRSYAL
jgi:anthranilate phosphoribosyltransferase